MTPNPLALADDVFLAIPWVPAGAPARKTLGDAAALLRTQHAEIERLTSCIKWEQNRAERIGTHGPGCEKWGSAHYECLLRSVERKDALLRQALVALKKHQGTNPNIYRMAIASITKELSQ